LVGLAAVQTALTLGSARRIRSDLRPAALAADRFAELARRENSQEVF
jgi:hypothetical protein